MNVTLKYVLASSVLSLRHTALHCFWLCKTAVLIYYINDHERLKFL